MRIPRRPSAPPALWPLALAVAAATLSLSAVALMGLRRRAAGPAPQAGDGSAATGDPAAPGTASAFEPTTADPRPDDPGPDDTAARQVVAARTYTVCVTVLAVGVGTIVAQVAHLVGSLGAGQAWLVTAVNAAAMSAAAGANLWRLSLRSRR